CSPKPNEQRFAYAVIRDYTLSPRRGLVNLRAGVVQVWRGGHVGAKNADRLRGSNSHSGAFDVLLGRRKPASESFIERRSGIERTRERLEHCLDLMVSVAAVEGDDMQVHPCLVRERLEEVANEI